MSARPLLIELFTEELPPKALKRLGESFAASVVEALRSRGLAAQDVEHRGFCSPRRLAVRVDAVVQQAPDRKLELKGPSVKVGLDAAGAPTQALVKWAEKQGASVDALAPCFSAHLTRSRGRASTRSRAAPTASRSASSIRARCAARRSPRASTP